MERCLAVVTVDVPAATVGTGARWVGDRVVTAAPSSYITGLCLRPLPCSEHAGVLVVRATSPATVCPCGGL